MLKEEKVLGKIDYAEFGLLHAMPFMMGLELGFSLEGGSSHICTPKYTVNISNDCKWKDNDRNSAVTDIIDRIHGILTDAKVCSVSELIGKPVQVTIDENNTFKDFRILTEVL